MVFKNLRSNCCTFKSASNLKLKINMTPDEPLYTDDESVYDADLENGIDTTCFDGDDPMDSIDASYYL